MNFSKVYFLWNHHFPLVYKCNTSTRMPAAASPSLDSLYYWLDSGWKKSLMAPQTASMFINCIFDVCLSRTYTMHLQGQKICSNQSLENHASPS